MILAQAPITSEYSVVEMTAYSCSCKKKSSTKPLRTLHLLRAQVAAMQS
jgi:hypothetical protein